MWNYSKIAFWITATLACLGVWALIAWGACQATGAPGVQTVSDRSGEWIGRELGVALEPRRVVVTDELYYPNSRAEVWPGEPGVYRIRPGIARLARGPWLSFEHRGPTLLGLHVVVHERLHRHETVACWEQKPGQVDVEEGIVDALALDLLPALAWHLYGERVRFFAQAQQEVAAIRAASRFASGADSWRDRRARHWRRAIWAADCAGRERMLLEAEARRTR
jgi:hypothetical protein